MSKLWVGRGRARQDVSVPVEWLPQGESVHLPVLGRSGQLHEGLNTLYNFGGTFSNILSFSINYQVSLCQEKIITDAVYKPNFDPKETGDKTPKKWLRVLLHKVQTGPHRNDLMCSDLRPTQRGKATAISRNHLPFLLTVVVIGHHVSVGPVTIKLPHFSPGGFYKFGLKKAASFKFRSVKVRRKKRRKKSQRNSKELPKPLLLI